MTHLSLLVFTKVISILFFLFFLFLLPIFPNLEDFLVFAQVNSFYNDYYSSNKMKNLHQHFIDLNENNNQETFSNKTFANGSENQITQMKVIKLNTNNKNSSIKYSFDNTNNQYIVRSK